MRRVVVVAALVLVAVVVALVGGPSRLPVEPPRFGEVPDWGVEPGDELWQDSKPSLARVIEETYSRFEDRGEQAPLTVGEAYQSSLTDGGLRFRAAAGDAEVDWSLSSITLGGSSLDRVGPWHVRENTGQRRIGVAGDHVTEHVSARAQGVERTWVLPSRPKSQGSLVVSTSLHGLTPVEHDGVKLEDAFGETRARIGPAFFVDSEGQRTEIDAELRGDELRYEVSETLLAAASYPAALDPIIGPEFGVDALTYAPGLYAVGGGAGGAVAAWLRQVGSQHLLSYARVSPDGTLLDRAAHLLEVNAYPNSHDVAVNGDRALIVWVAVGWELRSALIDLVTGEVVSKATLAPSASGPIAVATDGQDFLVAYHRLSFLRVNGATGQPFPGDAPVTNDYSFSTIQWPRLVFVNDHYIATFSGQHADSSQELVSIRIEDRGPSTSLQLQQTPTVIETHPVSTIRNPKLCAVGDSPLVVYRTDPSPGTRELRGQMLSTEGSVVDAPFRLADIDPATGHQPDVDCVGSSDGVSFFVSFSDHVPGHSGADVLVQRHNLSAVHGPQTVSDVSHWSSYARITPLGDSFLVIYQGSSSYPPKHIRYATLSETMEVGAPQLLAGSATAQDALALAGDPSRLIAAWTDDRLDSPNAYTIGYDVSGSPPVASLRADTRLALESGTSHPSLIVRESGYIAAARSAEGIVLTRVEDDAIRSVETLALEHPPGGSLAFAGGAPAEPIAGALAYLDSTQSKIYAFSVSGQGLPYDSPTLVASDCTGCLGAPSVAVNGDAVLVTYRSPAGVRGWLSTLGAFDTPVVGSVDGRSGLGDPAAVATGTAFTVYTPRESGSGAVLEAKSVENASGTLSVTGATWSPVPCASSTSVCRVSAATTGAWELVAWSRAGAELDETLAVAREVSSGQQDGPFSLSVAGVPGLMPAVAALGGSKFAVGTIGTVTDALTLTEQATVRLIDLEVDADGDGLTPADGDCDDSDATITTAQVYWRDLDGDGYGDPESATEPTCTAPAGYVSSELPADCDDTHVHANVDGTEEPGNHIDEDCSGDVLCFTDADGDGLGTGAVVLSSDGDCNDFGESVLPSDCDDSVVVGAFSGEAQAWFADADEDGFGNPAIEGGVSCTGPPGYVTNSDDCDDTTSSRRPGAFEACGDAIDANCDGYLDRAACHLDSCTPVSGLATALYQAGTRDPDPVFAPGPQSPSLRVEGLYADGSETEFRALDNLKLSIDPNTGAANLGGRFEVTGLNSPNGGGGSVGDVWTLSMTLTPSACSGCSPVLNERTQVHEAVAAWSFYAVSDAKLSSHSLINPQNEFTYEHTLTAPGEQPLQFGPAASGESLRCGLRFEFAHMFDFGAGTFSGQGELILDLVAIPGTETLAAAGGQ